MAAVKRKNKGGVEVKPFQIKNHLWVFINCLIENPTFDSQTKENMTLRSKAFGSTCDFSEKFIKQVCICIYIISSVMHAFWLVLTYDLLEDRCIDDVIIKIFLILYYIKQIDSKLPCICSVIDHRGRQNVVRTSVTHLAAPRVPLFCFYCIFTSSVIYYWTDAWQLGIYMLISLQLPSSCFHITPNIYVS